MRQTRPGYVLGFVVFAAVVLVQHGARDRVNVKGSDNVGALVGSGIIPDRCSAHDSVEPVAGDVLVAVVEYVAGGYDYVVTVCDSGNNGCHDVCRDAVRFGQAVDREADFLAGHSPVVADVFAVVDAVAFDDPVGSGRDCDDCGHKPAGLDAVSFLTPVAVPEVHPHRVLRVILD